MLAVCGEVSADVSYRQKKERNFVWYSAGF
jgi:hypothetical protein